MKHHLIFAIASNLTFMPSVSDAAGIYVSGSADCGAWHKARMNKTSSVLEGYTIGMLNGLALGSGVEFWRARPNEVSFEQAFLWVDKYCRDNPLDDVVAATVSLMNERTEHAYTRSHQD